MSDTYASLQQRLDECHEFPCAYVFKFIVPKDKAGDLESLLAGMPHSSRESKSGKFVSYTVETTMESSGSIIDLYKAAAGIEGLIAL